MCRERQLSSLLMRRQCLRNISQTSGTQSHTHKKIFWDCKLKISCVERDSKYFLRDLNILISLLPPIHISNAIHLKHSVVFFPSFFTNSKIAAIFISPSTVDAPKILNFIHFFLFCLNLSPSTNICSRKYAHRHRHCEKILKWENA